MYEFSILDWIGLDWIGAFLILKFWTTVPSIDTHTPASDGVCR